MTLEYFKLNDQWIDVCVRDQINLIPERLARGDVKPFGQHGAFLELLERVRLHYTAGEPIDEIAARFDEMFTWFVKWHLDFPQYVVALQQEFGGHLDTSATPVDLESLEGFHELISVVGLAVLLGKGEALQTVADLFKSKRGEDMLLEELLAPAIVDPVECHEFFHLAPYDPLVDAFATAATPDEGSAYVKKYLNGWYKSMSGCSWHNGHLLQQEYRSNYNGYWAFEAAALSVIRSIDDTSYREHLVYPKDLADWARENGSVGKLVAEATARRQRKGPRLRCQSGDTCPQAGFWFTPARADSGRLFAVGEPMPDVGGAYGTTIWQLGAFV